jgi:uncharacterized protein YdgA (DUF945 family)
MRKLLIAILVLALLLLLTVPGVVGMHAEGRYQQMVGQLQASGLRVVRNDYQRDWFGAMAETELELPMPQDAAPQKSPQPLRFVLRSEISHGPFSPTKGVTGDQLIIDSEFLSDGKPLFPTDYPALIQTRISLDGDGRTLIDLPSLDLPGGNGQPEIQFKGVKGEMGFHANYGHLDMDLKLPYLRIDNGQGALFELEGVILDGAYERGVAGLMLGSGGISVSRVEMLSGQVASLEMQGLGAKIVSSAEGELVKGAVRYTLDSVVVNGDSYGPAELDLRVDSLSAPVLGRMQKAMDEMATQNLPHDQRGMAILSVILSSGEEFLRSDPRLVLERLHVKTPEGVIQGRFRLQPIGLEWAEISNIAAILNKLDAETELQMPEPLFHALFEQQARQVVMMQVEQQRMLGKDVATPDFEQLEAQVAAMADQQLESLLQQEVLVRKGGDIATLANLKDGLLTVNGKSLPLPILAPPPAQ